MTAFDIACADCGRAMGDPHSVRCVACGGLWRINYGATDEAWPARPLGLWDYGPWLPIENAANRVSLGEGGTPLVRATGDGLPAELFWKLECQNPTGSQKDRGVSVAISRALELGARRVLTVSTGSSGLACAAYAARAGLAAVVLVPEGTPASRLAAMQLFGARVIEVEGDFPETYRLLERLVAAPGWTLVATNRRSNPWQAEGTRTLGFEIATEMIAVAGQMPDWIVVPVGGGGTISGVWRGLTEMQAAGRINRLPRLAAAHAARVDRIARAVAAGADDDAALAAITNPAADTVMFNLKGGARSDLADAVAAIRHSGGRTVAVSEDESLAAQRRLAAEGLFVEPSAAAAEAAVRTLAADGTLRPGERCVAVLTGSGFRDAIPASGGSLLQATPDVPLRRIGAWLATAP
ncbi:MAG: pyridoxal-phosphate dependent enzyme [Alphaproteobacteria bacterium]